MRIRKLEKRLERRGGQGWFFQIMILVALQHKRFSPPTNQRGGERVKYHLASNKHETAEFIIDKYVRWMEKSFSGQDPDFESVEKTSAYPGRLRFLLST